MDAQADTAEPVQGAAVPSAGHGGWRRWLLRVFVLGLLLAGAGTVGVAMVTIVSDAKTPNAARRAEFGVVMPDAATYRKVVGKLLDRKHPELLRGMTIVGGQGEVTVLKAQRRAPFFPSTYLNPNALSVIARSIGVRSDTQITVDELRLEILRSTGRLRWRVRGVQDGRAWRAVVAPNGTNLHLIGTKAS
ncbi:MAG: hypothetical protein JWO02_3220 [Solirubrobacterales bacterium]|nr:hypothetical protein [Solirubrobacterales bacterium]